MSVPPQIKHKLLYESKYVCCICQKTGVQIHHIDGNNSNNVEVNLIVLCIGDHNEAHTKRTMTQNLTPEALRAAKKRWCARVESQREAAATHKGQMENLSGVGWEGFGITWGYINHNRVSQSARPDLLEGDNSDYFHYSHMRGLIDSKGVLVKPETAKIGRNYVVNSVYDWFEQGDSLRLHIIYSMFVDQFSRATRPIHLEPEGWTRSWIKNMLRPGQVFFANRGFFFKGVQTTIENEHRMVYAFKRKIRLEFFVDTRDMFGTTSMTVSFRGHKNCAALIQLKSIEKTEDGWMILHCTPIALGVGFNADWEAE